MTTENIPEDFQFHNRHTVGEKILLMRYNPAAASCTVGTGLFVPRFLPWEQVLNQNTPLYLKELVVTERHAVPGDWDDKPQHTGFVARDHVGQLWYNQYPRASYGQLNDIGDTRWTHSMFRCAYDHRKQDLYDALPVRDYGQYEEVTRRLDGMLHAVSPTSCFVLKDPGLRQALAKHYEWLVRTIEKMANVTIEKHVLFQEHPDLITHRVVWK